MIQEALVAALAPLVDGRVFPLVAPNNTTAPYLIYQRVASVPENTLSSGVPINQARIQVDIYDSGYASCQSLAQAVQGAIAANFSASILQLEQDFYEQDVKLFRVMHDYSMWT